MSKIRRRTYATLAITDSLGIALKLYDDMQDYVYFRLSTKSDSDKWHKRKLYFNTDGKAWFRSSVGRQWLEDFVTSVPLETYDKQELEDAYNEHKVMRAVYPYSSVAILYDPKYGYTRAVTDLHKKVVVDTDEVSLTDILYLANREVTVDNLWRAIMAFHTYTNDQDLVDAIEIVRMVQ